MYQLSTEYAWYDTREESKVVLVYMIQGIPFTFDELPEIVEITGGSRNSRRK